MSAKKYFTIEERHAATRAIRIASYERHREERRADLRIYYVSHRAEQIAYHRARLAINRENERRRYATDPTKKLRSVAAWRDRNRSLRAERQRAYYARRKDYFVVDAVRRRAARLGVPGSFTEQEWRSLVIAHGGRCAYCGIVGKMTVDHRIAIARGGTNNISNILPACATCNMRKHTMSEEEFRHRSAPG